MFAFIRLQTFFCYFAHCYINSQHRNLCQIVPKEKVNKSFPVVIYQLDMMIVYSLLKHCIKLMYFIQPLKSYFILY